MGGGAISWFSRGRMEISNRTALILLIQWLFYPSSIVLELGVFSRLEFFFHPFNDDFKVYFMFVCEIIYNYY